ncbi:hypothetical protein CF642_31935 [Burkholderia pseudomallei]|nr:hypothetical protein CF642_31935 [Burkholderia pseudomallei]
MGGPFFLRLVFRRNAIDAARRPTPDARRPTPDARRPTHNAQRTTHNAQRTTHNAQRFAPGTSKHPRPGGAPPVTPRAAA